MKKPNPMPEIETLLKSLNLTGLKENLFKHNKEAIDNKLTYPEFLTLILQEELLRREQKRFSVSMKRSKIRSDKTLENFDFAFNANINYAQIKDLATCRFIEEKVCGLIVGPCGTGKSHLAHAIGNCAVRANISTLFIKASKLMEEIRAAMATNCYKKFKQKICKLPLLIIDDFGLKPFITPEDEYFHEIISDRHETAATLITSNLDFSEWIQAFPNKLLGVATLDRIRHMAYLLILEGINSHREFKEKTVIVSKNLNNTGDGIGLKEVC